MDDTTLKVETATPAAPSNEVKPDATLAPAPVNAPDSAEFERLKKEAKQAQMRANQLENQLKEKAEAEEAAKKKQLEEQEQYKELYEQEKTRRETIETEAERKEREEALRKAQDDVLAGYSDEIKSLAAEAGMGLTDVNDDAVATFKQKLDKINDMVGGSQVKPNNPRQTNNQTPELSGDDLKLALRDDPEAFHKIVSERLPSVKNWRNR